MPVEMDKRYKKEEIYVKTSPVFELINAFHVLVLPEHHGFLKPWADNIRQRLTDEEIDVLDLLSRAYGQGCEMNGCVFDIGEFDSCDRFLNKFGEYEITDFLYSFLEENVGRDKIKECMDSPRDSFEILRNLLGDWMGTREIIVCASIIDRRYDIHKCILSMLSKIYSKDFIDIIKSQEKNYELQVQSALDRLKSVQPLDLAQEIMGKKFARISNYSKYYFIPSYFLYPHNIRVFNDDILVQIFSYGHDESFLENKLEEISSCLQVVSDKTRLKILRLLISGKSYGKVIASRLNLTTATISHHLDILKEAGLVTEERTENVKYFIYNEGRVEEIMQALQDYLYNKD